MLLDKCLFILFIIPNILALVQKHDWYLKYKEIKPDPNTSKTRRIISINDQWPPPNLNLNKGDTLRIQVHNELDEDTSLHFHGIFQNGTNEMDGPSMITQCPIPKGESFIYEFQINQTGTFWYHSHDRTQYGDGLRGALIIKDPEEENNYEDDVVITLTDWYDGITNDLLIASHGHEPSINDGLFNDTKGTQWRVKPNKQYLIRLINMGMSGSQFFYIENHNLTIVEIDGVKVKPTEVDSVNLATGQRYGVILKTKDQTMENFGMVSAVNLMMRKKYVDNWIIYNPDAELPVPNHINTKELGYIDDLELKPMDDIKLYENPKHSIVLTYSSITLPNRDDDYFYTINSKPFFPPQVPTLMTIMSSSPHDVLKNQIYGNLTNSYIFQKGDVVEVIVKSEDHMRHPFHLHGHNFQVLTRGSHQHYDKSKDYKFSETPMIRDTVNVPGSGFVILRFIADNPGVWFFHCHTDWHAARGLASLFIVAPDVVQKTQHIKESNLQVCKKAGIVTSGNAAGNKGMNMTGDLTLEMLNKKPINQTLTSINTNTTNTTTNNTNNNTKNSFNDKIKILVIYISFMLILSMIGGVYVNKKIQRDSSIKRRVQSIPIPSE
ncbi:Iron transport multicopper oxidase FET3 [Wickerhamomyces ciferrii]|uniref:Iron transport multicopper oxidase FET3 n=1 Tax=Wickerhamomyces ciferrii (strain ATCC 14091 / BCRC 22168 / CBS 111 / JCM 3599 / NBRC 0793 / NRRL Y-1031 F-60-10) TaxID=1206466 RepID=K0KKA6_WICCF|nr:Iron transport multicopper oxidase FET3 [Wickerhamomyces ciferrii]CCH43376.1 Iron transport multicopper oxidase FET3 [Wickerhamomyces ciferrii]